MEEKEDVDCIKEAIDLLRNMKIKRSEDLMEEVMATNGVNGEKRENDLFMLNIIHHRSEAGLYRYLTSMEDVCLTDLESLLERVCRECNLLIKTSKRRIIDANKRIVFNCEINSILGENCLIYSLLRLRSRNYIKGVYNLNKSWRYFSSIEDCFLEELSSNSKGRVLLARGLFHLVFSMIPHHFKWLSDLFGFKGDKEGAESELRNCISQDNIRSTEAKFLLAVFLWFFEKDKTQAREEADQVLDCLISEYPNGALYKMFVGHIHLRDGNVDKASDFFQLAAHDAEEVPQFKYTIEYELGHCRFLQNRWDECIPATRDYLRFSKSKEFRAFACFKLGVCYLKTGQHLKEVENLYKNILPTYVRRDINYDCYALKKSQQFLKQGNKFTDFQLIFFEAQNFIEANKFSEIPDIIGRLEDTLSDCLSKGYTGTESLSDLQAQLEYVKAKMLKGNGEIKSAVRGFLEIINELSPQLSAEEKWVVPFSMFELAELFLGLGKDEASTIRMKNGLSHDSAARKLLTSAKSYPFDYDFKKILNMRISRLQKQLGD